jgi:acylglycerol lipase
MKINTKDNLKLHCDHWDIAQPKAVVLLVHGLGEHGRRYTHWAKMFNENNYTMRTMDLRGHGFSEGQRGYIPDYEAFIDDVEVFIQQAKSDFPNSKIVLYGHSLGGGLVLNYLVRRPSSLAALIATGPFITLSFEPNPLVFFLGKIMRKIYPKFSQNNQLDTTSLSRDVDVVKKYNDDPLVHDRLSASLGLDSLNAGLFLSTYKGEITTPILLAHGGDDKTTNPEGTIGFYHNTTGKRTLKIFPKLYHEIHNEPEQKEVFTYILSWLNDTI